MANCYNDCIHCFVCQYVNHEEYPSVQQLKNNCRFFRTSADVVPKSEVAREIFEEIEKHLFVIAPIEEFDGWARIQLADIMRLKNKYTETEPPRGD